MVFYTVYLLDGENLFVSTRTMSIKSEVQQEKIDSSDSSDQVQEKMDTSEDGQAKVDKEKEDEDQDPGNGGEQENIKMM